MRSPVHGSLHHPELSPAATARCKQPWRRSAFGAAGFLTLLVVAGVPRVSSAQSFGLPSTLDGNQTRVINHEIAAGGGGTWVTVWRSWSDLGGTIGADDDILVARSIDGGVSWTASSALNSFAGSDSDRDWEPSLASDGSGNWVAVWASEHSLPTIGNDFDILVSRSSDDGATWTAAVALNDFASTDGASDDDRSPRVASDGSGNWVCIWFSSHAPGGQ